MNVSDQQPAAPKDGSRPVRIGAIASAHPAFRLTQDEAAARIGALTGDSRRVAALARGTQIDRRSLAATPEELLRLGSAGARNDRYRQLTPALALRAARGVLGERTASDVGCIVTTSCTGYTAPSWGVGLAEECGIPRDAIRLPITEAGCAGGVVALARAADHLRLRGGNALVTSVELCSLAFHPGGDDGNLTSSLIFGDGAGAALLHADAGPGLEVLDWASMLIPDSQYALGFDLTDAGFYPLLARELATLLPEPTVEAVDGMLARNSLGRGDIGAWLVHPGGARILASLEHALDVGREQLRWSWDSMREFGNTSSAAIFDVVRRYFAERVPGEYAVVAAFGPGVSIELLLVRAS